MEKLQSGPRILVGTTHRRSVFRELGALKMLRLERYGYDQLFLGLGRT